MMEIYTADMIETTLLLLILARVKGKPSGMENTSVSKKIDTVTPIPLINFSNIMPSDMNYLPKITFRCRLPQGYQSRCS